LTDIIIPEYWWNDLEAQWKRVFRIFINGDKSEPDADDLQNIFSTETIRLAGPKAPFPNMQFELTNLSGLKYLRTLSIVIVTHHSIENIEVLRNLTNLKSLFLFNNNIETLTGIEELTELEQLYVQCNQISSLKPIEKLINLKELYISDNRIESLDGLTEMHSEKLTMFVCRPNENLKQKEIIRTERDLGIICR